MATQAPIDPAVPMSETAAPAGTTTTVHAGAPAPTSGYSAPAAGYAAGGAQPPKDDIAEWIDRVKAVIDKPETVTAPAPANARSWHSGFWEFFDPIDTCASQNFPFKSRN